MTDNPLHELEQQNDGQQLDAKVKHDPVDTGKVLVERGREEMKDQKNQDLPPKFTSQTFGRMEIVGDDGSALVKGYRPQ